MTSTATIDGFALTVPGTDIPLVVDEGHLRADGTDGTAFGMVSEVVWDLTHPDQRPTFDRFATEYAAIRTAEQRDLSAEEVRELPQVRADHPLAQMWEQRAASYALLPQALVGLSPGRAIDIGAGCGWLAAGLARMGWTMAATDITVDGGDGLAAARHHAEDLLLVRADMHSLPFASESVDLVVFNASLHYGAPVTGALQEAARVITPGGRIVVMDSPTFEDPAAGHQMVAESHEQLSKTLDVLPAALPGPGFVARDDLVGFAFERLDSASRVRTAFHRWRGARRAGREVAERPVLVAPIGADT